MVPATGCYVCQGLMDGLAELIEHILQSISKYDYETFTVGATLSPSVLDRDDYIRSRMGAAGAASIKAALTGEAGSIISGRTGKRLDRDDPDITILLDTRFGSCEVRSRHAVVGMRYTKTRRGIPQKCGACAPAIPSIEDMISGYLLGMMGGTDVRFTWVGGEDRDSLVLGHGRPVYARVRNPVRSAGVLPASVSLDGIHISHVGPADGVPSRLPPFSSVARVVVRCSDMSGLRRLKALAGIVMVGTDSGRPSARRVGTIRYRRTGADSFRITMEVEGGIPIKRLVSGEGVEPSVSSMLGAECTCVRFDFLDILINKLAATHGTCR